MIGFLQPLALLGLVAAAVPPLLHLLARRLPPQVPFPAVRYLAETKRQHSRRLKLRNLWLLVLRTLVIITIALAAARPVARVPLGTAHEPTALGLVIDNSLSAGAIVDGERVVDRLATRARALLDLVGEDDRVWLTLADGVPQRTSVLEARAMLDTLVPGATRLDLTAAARATAHAVAAAPIGAHAVVLMSDLQATAFAGRVDLPETVRVFAWGPEPLAANRGVDSARARPVVWAPEGDVVVAVGGSDPSPTTVRLLLNGRDVSRAVGGGADQLVLRGGLREPGWYTGAVVLDPDELRADDRRAVAVRVAPPARLAVAAAAGPFVAEAAAVLYRSGRAQRGVDVTIGDTPGRGVTVVVPPSDPALLGALNRDLTARGVNWRFGDEVRGEWIADGAVGPAAGATVTRRRRVEGNGVVMGRTGGDPWLVRDGDVILLASRLEPEWTDLPLAAAFVPFVDFLANRVAATPAWVTRAVPGGPVDLPPGARAMTGPDGRERSATAGPTAAPLETGVFFILGAASDTLGALEVNHDPRESRLAPVNRRGIRAALGDRAELVSDRDLERSVFRAVQRADLTGLLIVVALGLVLAELALSSTSGAGRRDG